MYCDKITVAVQVLHIVIAILSILFLEKLLVFTYHRDWLSPTYQNLLFFLKTFFREAL